jgi:hypothetical protein
MSVWFVLIDARKPVRQRNQERNMPSFRSKGLRRDTRGECYMINVFSLGNRDSSRDNVRL